ncbi:MAG: hypothetical protein KC421_19855 [Anaerolineales bacterium]|nr:hypothetical protein [Anaerolineales bacterium]
MPENQYNFQTIRELLSAAFNASEIKTLAFDRFPEVNEEFTPGMIKSQIVGLLLDWVKRNGQVELLLSEIKQRNPYQYDRFAGNLLDLTAQRLRDIEEHIQRERMLLNQYQEQLSYESDPRRIAGIKANIERQKQSLLHYQQEAAALGATIDLPELDEPPATPIIEDPVDEDLLTYVAEEQEWYPTDYPSIDTISPEMHERFQKEIDVVLIVATEVELAAVLHKLAPYPRRKRVLRIFLGAETYFLGKFGEYKTAVTRCGMGTTGHRSSAQATPDAIRTWKPRAIIMPGIAFGKDPDKQKIADVMVASKIVPYEKQRRGQQTIFRAAIPPSDVTLQNRFENAIDWQFNRPDDLPCKLRIGAILSGDKLVDDPQFKASLFNEFPEAIGGEMEGAGLADAAVRLNTPWILVKAICDWGDGKKHGKHQPLAAAASVSLVHHVLSQKGVLPRR